MDPDLRSRLGRPKGSCYPRSQKARDTSTSSAQALGYPIIRVPGMGSIPRFLAADLTVGRVRSLIGTVYDGDAVSRKVLFTVPSPPAVRSSHDQFADVFSTRVLVAGICLRGACSTLPRGAGAGAASWANVGPSAGPGSGPQRAEARRCGNPGRVCAGSRL